MIPLNTYCCSTFVTTVFLTCIFRSHSEHPCYWERPEYSQSGKTKLLLSIHSYWSPCISPPLSEEFSYAAKCKIFRKFDLKVNLSETWINTSNLEVIDEVKSVPGSQHLCPLRATVWAMLVQHFWCWQNYLVSDEWYSRWESYAKDQKKSLYCHCALAQNTQKPFFWQFDHSINTKTLHQHGSNCSPEWAPMLWTSNTLYCSNYFKIWYDYSGLTQVKGVQPSGQIFRKFYT